MKMNNYIVHLKHDDGECDIAVTAQSVDVAEHMVMESEKCPKSAIKSVRCYKDIREFEDQRTLQELAQEAIDVQGACNLLGISKSFAASIQRLKDLLPTLGTQQINEHAITVMWVAKFNLMMNPNEFFSNAYSACRELAKKPTWDSVDTSH